ncbi:hypothetical protein Gohar_017304 [Gossypium harknessii]|uniref:RNase H type-1 domain-containing protein n=1 Tax=Gossypium harknessii TaxID=34285 RepID=A0A7J9G5V7_9ROSI|nr:hypothetical protein [Gossypium harknessii]
MGACSRVAFQVPTMFAAEAISIFHGLQFAFKMGFWSIILESDAQAAIYKLNATSKDLPEINAFIYQATELSKSFLDGSGGHVEVGGWRLGRGSPVLATSISDEDRRLIDPP